MGKININIKVNNYQINTKGIKQNNIIKCIDNNDKNTKIKIDTNNLILTRENNEQTITIDFKKQNIEYFLKEHNKKVKISIKVKEIIQKKDNIKIKYTNETNNFILEISYK